MILSVDRCYTSAVHSMLTGLIAVSATLGAGSGSAMSPTPPSSTQRARFDVLGLPLRQPGFHVVWGLSVLDSLIALSSGIHGDAMADARAWNGESWVSTEPPGGQHSELYDVDASTAADAWAVGDVRGQSLAAHWDGRNWAKSSTPAAEAGYADSLSSVSVAARDDVWAVGYSFRYDEYVFDPLVEHWNGHRWTKTEIELPGNGNGHGYLSAVSVIDADDAYAVGIFGSAGAWIEHWDGEDWTPERDVPPHGGGDVFRALATLADDDVWAVGASSTGTVTVHWNGQRWRPVRSPDARARDGANSLLYGVTGASAHDVWAVGYSGDFYVARHTFILHWDGNRWARVPAPSPGRKYNALYAVSAARPDDVWAGGYFSNADSQDDTLPLYLHWNGEKWVHVQQR